MFMSLIRISLRETASKAKTKRKKKKTVEIFELLIFLLYLLFPLTHLLSSQASGSHRTYLPCGPHTRYCLHFYVPYICIPRAFTPGLSVLGHLRSCLHHSCWVPWPVTQVTGFAGHRSLSIHGFGTCGSDYTSVPKVFGTEIHVVFLTPEILRVCPRWTELVDDLSRQPSLH